MIPRRCASPTSACDGDDVQRTVLRLAGRAAYTGGLCGRCRSALVRMGFDVIVDQRTANLPWAIERRDRVSM